MRKHWYFIDIEECVLCGRTRVYRERRYTRRPKSAWYRHRFSQFACSEHF